MSTYVKAPPRGLHLAEFLLCGECGAVVWDRDIHDQWHGYHGQPVDSREVKVLFKGEKT
jgi:hypothetical protein